MARNIYFTDKVKSEHELYENIVIESLKIYGQDVYYVPRDLVNEDTVFGDDAESSFNSAYKVEMYLDNIEGFEGEGDLFTRFGVEIRDECTFVVSRRRWNQTVSRYDNEITGERPREGDLVYLPLSNSLFQITHVEHEMPFYQVSNLNVYKLRAQLFEYTGEDLDTGIGAIDKVETDFAYKYILTLDSSSAVTEAGQTATMTLSDGVIVTGEVASYEDSSDKLSLIHVGASDGKYHTFVTGRQIILSAGASAIRLNAAGASVDSSFNVLAVVEENQVSQNEQNTFFSTESTDFLDFTEDNPFGDPENN
jgi:hypothetical protein